MDLILDTSILIASERRKESPKHLLRRISTAFGSGDIMLSAVSVVELTHGIYRAQTDQIRTWRRTFAEEIFRGLVVQPVTLEIALLAGRIEGQQASVGNIIAFEDLVIGATALYVGFSVMTLNRRHFEKIPDLHVVGL